MGFHRLGQPAAQNRAQVTAIITRFVADELAFETRTIDPFLVDHGCVNPSGHEPIASCGEIVCCHCAKVFWR